MTSAPPLNLGHRSGVYGMSSAKSTRCTERSHMGQEGKRKSTAEYQVQGKMTRGKLVMIQLVESGIIHGWVSDTLHEPRTRTWCSLRDGHRLVYTSETKRTPGVEGHHL